MQFQSCTNKTQEDRKMQEQYSVMDAMGLKWNVRKKN